MVFDIYHVRASIILWCSSIDFFFCTYLKISQRRNWSKPINFFICWIYCCNFRWLFLFNLWFWKFWFIINWRRRFRTIFKKSRCSFGIFSFLLLFPFFLCLLYLVLLFSFCTLTFYHFFFKYSHFLFLLFMMIYISK